MAQHAGIVAISAAASLIAAFCGARAVRAADDAARSGEVPAAFAARWPRLSSGPLQDNSFLIEEAYNQERGVIQHIVSAAYDRESGDWQATVTQEWPVPDETNQLSFTVPYALMGRGEDGAGDVLLNYRYQLAFERERRPALAPRLSLVLPTGSVRDGAGDGSVGVQVLVPASKQLGEHFAAHLNLGATILPRARAVDPPRHDRLVSWTGGGSLIWEPYNAINILAELLASRDAEIAEHGIDHETRVTFSPGVRVGWNGPWGVQWVVGVALPIGLTRPSDDLGVFLYFSAEQAVTAAARAARNW